MHLNSSPAHQSQCAGGNTVGEHEMRSDFVELLNGKFVLLTSLASSFAWLKRIIGTTMHGH